MTVGSLTRAELSMFDPRKLPGLEAWYDAKAINGLGAVQPAEGTPLAQWNDLSGKGRHLVQATSTKRPIFRSVPNIIQPPSFTVLAGGATYDAATGEYTLVNTTSTVAMWAYVGGQAASCNVEADYYSDVQSPYAGFAGSAGTLTNTQYFAADKVTAALNTSPSPGPYSGNEAAKAFPMSAWTRIPSVFTLGPAIHWVKWTIQGATHTSLPGKVRRPSLRVSPTAAYPPVAPYIPPINGPSVVFDGVDDYLAMTTHPNVHNGGTGPATLYCVGTQVGANSLASWNQRWISSSTDGTNSSGGGNRVAMFPYHPMIYTYSGTNGITRSSAGLCAPQVASGWTDGIDGAGIATNGSAVSALLTGRGPSSLNNPFYMSATSGNQALLGSIAAGLFFSRKHDEATRRRIEQWLAARYAVPLARP